MIIFILWLLVCYNKIYKYGYDIIYFLEILNDGSLNFKVFFNYFWKVGYKIDFLINIVFLWIGIILICKIILKSLCLIFV